MRRISLVRHVRYLWGEICTVPLILQATGYSELALLKSPMTGKVYGILHTDIAATRAYAGSREGS
jgi:hypothetical protein